MSQLMPTEALALKVALAQVKRGEEPLPHVSTMCVLALARLVGTYDWTTDEPVVVPYRALEGSEGGEDGT